MAFAFTDPNLQGELERDREGLRASRGAPFFATLREGLWHTTSPRGYLGIRATGAIEPNGGRFPYSYPQSAAAYGEAHGYVCLFDFATPSEDECAWGYFKWTPFFDRCTPVIVALQLDRAALAPRLIANAVPTAARDHAHIWLPYVEAWYDGPIPLSAVWRYLVMPRDPAGPPRWIAPDDTAAHAALADLIAHSHEHR
ncbi:MAG TPA: hypothetical protein VFS40_12520 [Gemmatimonadales bacterium]|nr:hypothetical protein [Gemmatimonadales bacterium]